MNLHEELQYFGLNKSEIAIYLFLLEEGMTTPPQIAGGTKIARTNCYHILTSLLQKGLIEKHQKGKRKAYIACDPEALLRSLEQKKEAVSRLLPDLRGMYTLQKNKPKIRFYEGFDQVKQIYFQSLSTSSQSIFAIGSTKHLEAIDPQFFEQYIQTIKEKGIMLSDILSYESGEKVVPDTKKILKGYYDAFVVPKKYEDFETDILLWDDHIALITLEEPIFGTVLTNRALAQTFRTIFQVMKSTL